MNNPELIRADDKEHYSKAQKVVDKARTIRDESPEGIARAMQVEYQGQASRMLDPTKQFVLIAKAAAMGEFLTRLNYIAGGEKG